MSQGANYFKGMAGTHLCILKIHKCGKLLFLWAANSSIAAAYQDDL